jgi:hypothetical protein
MKNFQATGEAAAVQNMTFLTLWFTFLMVIFVFLAPYPMWTRETASKSAHAKAYIQIPYWHGAKFCLFMAQTQLKKSSY